MRLTIIGPVYPMRGGIAHHVYWLHRELSARGHQVQVISYRSLYPGILFPGITVYDTSEMKLDAGARAMLTPLNPISWIRALKAAKSASPDLVIIQWWNTFFAPLVGMLGRMLRRAGIRTIIECHNVLPHERRWIDRSLVKFAFSPADDFITHSKTDREELLGVLPGKRVRVAPLPILNEFSAGARTERKGRTILFFGIVRKYKGLDVLLRALPKVLSEVDCNLVVSGEFYEPVDKYQQLIRDLGISSSVRIENRYVANEEVAALFNQADVLVLPYLSATQSAVAGIAIANGLPIIASRTGGLSEAVQENVTGLLFPPGDADALADRLVYYFTSDARQRFCENLMPSEGGRERSELADVIEEIAGE